MTDRRRAVGALVLISGAMIAFVLYSVVRALGSGGFAPLDVIPALVPPAALLALAVGLERAPGWATIVSRVLAVALALIGGGAVVWLVVVSPALGDAVSAAVPIVFLIVAGSALAAILLWRGSRSPQAD